MMQPNTEELLLQEKHFLLEFFWLGKVIKMVTYKSNYNDKLSIPFKAEHLNVGVATSKLTRKVRHLLICWLYKVMRDTNAYKRHDFSFIPGAREMGNRTFHASSKIAHHS